jgi:lysozyme
MPVPKVVSHGVSALSGAAMALAVVFIPHWEGMDLTVKHYAVDPPGVYTVCNGITNLDPEYAWIRPGMKFTEPQCAEAFKRVLPTYIEPLAACIDNYYLMPPHRQIALLSAGYNLGTGAICKSTAVRLINAGKTTEGCKALGNFIKANGVVLQGLKNRRFDPKWGEIAWCLRSD